LETNFILHIELKTSTDAPAILSIIFQSSDRSNPRMVFFSSLSLCAVYSRDYFGDDSSFSVLCGDLFDTLLLSKDPFVDPVRESLRAVRPVNTPSIERFPV
jgi:hypothetical protein